MLNEAVYNEQSFLYNQMAYMSVACAQPDKKHRHKVESRAKKLKPKYIFNYDLTPDNVVKDDLKDLINFRENFKENIDNDIN